MNIYFYFLEIFEQIRRRFFVEDGTGYSPCDSTLALSEGSFSVVGQLMSSSIAQGGPPPNFLAEWVYDYINKGIEGLTVDISKLDGRLKSVAEKVILFLLRLILSCCFSKYCK